MYSTTKYGMEDVNIIITLFGRFVVLTWPESTPCLYYIIACSNELESNMFLQ